MPNTENLFSMIANATPPPTGNHSNTTREELIDILSTFQKVGLTVPYFIIEPLALVLNFLTLFIVCNREKHARQLSKNAPCQNTLRSQLKTYYFLRHLVFSDLLTCFVAIPFDVLEIHRLEFRRSHQYCAVSKYVRFVAISTSFYILVVTNFERFWSLTFPFRQLSDRAVVYMIRGAWLTAFVINIPCLFLFHSSVQYMYDNTRYYVRVCMADQGIKGKTAHAYLGITFLIPAIAIAILSVITMYRAAQIEKAYSKKRPGAEDPTADSSKVGLRSVVVLSSYITAGFWFCISPTGFYHLIITDIGRPVFPTSYLIGRSIVIIANASAVVNPVVTILCFPPIKDRAKRYLGLGAKESYSTSESNNRVNADEKNNIQLLTFKIRSSFRKVRHALKGSPAENENDDTKGTAKTDGSAKVWSGEIIAIEETVTSVIERVPNDCRQTPIQSTEI